MSLYFLTFADVTKRDTYIANTVVRTHPDAGQVDILRRRRSGEIYVDYNWFVMRDGDLRWSVVDEVDLTRLQMLGLVVDVISYNN